MLSVLQALHVNDEFAETLCYSFLDSSFVQKSSRRSQPLTPRADPQLTRRTVVAACCITAIEVVTYALHTWENRSYVFVLRDTYGNSFLPLRYLNWCARKRHFPRILSSVGPHHAAATRVWSPGALPPPSLSSVTDWARLTRAPPTRRAHTVPTLIYMLAAVAEVPSGLVTRTIWCAAAAHRTLTPGLRSRARARHQHLCTPLLRRAFSDAARGPRALRRLYWVFLACVVAASLAALPRFALVCLLSFSSFLSLTVLRSVFLMLMSTLSTTRSKFAVNMDRCEGVTRTY